MGRESSGVVGFDLGPLLEGQMRTAVLVHCLYGGYNLHRFSDALGLVKFANLILLPYISFIIAFTALEWISYKESLISQSDLPPDPLVGQTGVIK